MTYLLVLCHYLKKPITCVTAVYLVAQYARYEMRRMEEVIELSLLFIDPCFGIFVYTAMSSTIGTNFSYALNAFVFVHIGGKRRFKFDRNVYFWFQYWLVVVDLQYIF